MATSKKRISDRSKAFWAEFEERNPDFRIAHEKLLQAIKSGEEARQSIIKTCARSVGAPSECDMNRVIWHGVVRYANADLTVASDIAKTFLAFQAFSSLCVIRQDDPLHMMTGLQGLPFHDLESKRRAGLLTTFGGFFDACCSRLYALHQPFRNMLTWLADPLACSTVQRNEAMKFLVEHGGEGAVEIDLRANDNFDDTGNEGAPFLYWKSARAYKTILSPVARFIWDRIEQYQADEDLRLTLKEVLPLMICKRPACRRFALLRRATKDFCSASCRTLYRQETKPEAHAAYQRKYREIYKKLANTKKRG